MDRYSIDLPHGRSLALSAEQLQRIATGLGDQLDAPPGNGQTPPIIEALRKLPEAQRGDALSVVLMRFGEKQDVETISHNCGLSPWQVWQLEAAFRRALAEVRISRPRLESRLADQLEESQTARVMSPEMLSNAIAHGESVDLEREHEASLRAVEELRG